MPTQRHDLLNRDGQIRVNELRRVERSLDKFGQILPSGGPFLDTSFGQVSQIDAGSGLDGMILAIIVIANDATPRMYSWVEADRVTLAQKTSGRTGIYSAREINGKIITIGTRVWLVPDGVGGYDFDAEAIAGGSTAVTSIGFAKTVAGGILYPGAGSLLASISATATGVYVIAGSAWQGDEPTNFWQGYGSVQLSLWYHTVNLGYVPIGGASLYTGTPAAVIPSGDGAVDIVGAYGLWSVRRMAVARSALSASVIASIPANASVQIHFLNDILGPSPTNELSVVPQDVQGIFGLTRVG